MINKVNYLYVFFPCLYCLVYSILVFYYLFALYNRICIVFILCSVSFIACVISCNVFCLSVVCYFV
jgi:hypothetical protein